MTEFKLKTKFKKMGYSIINEDTIKCPDCLKELIQIIKVKESPKINKIMVVCPYCGEESFWHTISGEILINPCEKIKLIDVDTQVDVDMYTSKIKVAHE